VLLVLIAEHPDLTLDEVVAGLHKRRIASSRSALWRFFKRHKITLKKTLHAAEQEQADVARARRRWIGAQGLLDTTRLVFIDETAANTKMARLNRRCPRGERLVGRVPFGHWKTITEQCLAPTLKLKDTVMMDNLPVHKVSGVREAIEARGATLRYLPKYSPETSPAFPTTASPRLNPPAGTWTRANERGRGRRSRR
jgi:transposase